MDGKALAVGGYFDISRANGDHGGVPGGIGVDAVFAGTQKSDSAVGSIDLPRFTVKEVTHAQADTAGVDAGLDDVIAEVHELEIGSRVQADRVLADPQNGA